MIVLRFSVAKSDAQITVYEDNPFTINGIYTPPGSCVAPLTYSIGNAGGTGLNAGTVNPNNSLTPTGGGSFTLSVSDASGANCATQTFTVASFNSAFTGTCFTWSLQPTNVPAGCTTSFLVDGLPITLTGGNYNFEYGGDRVVTMRVTCGANTYNIIKTITVAGPDAQLTVSALQTDLITGQPTSAVVEPLGLGNFQGIYPYCDSPLGSFEWTFNDGPHQPGHSSGTVSSVEYTHGSYTTSSSGIPSNVVVTDTDQNGGYATLTYTTTSGGCTAVREYSLFMSNSSSPGTFTGSPPNGSANVWTNSGFCYGDAIPIYFEANNNNPSGTNYVLAIACGQSISSLNDPSIFQTIDLSAQITTNNSSYIYNWIADRSSCNCPGGQITVKGFAQNPCNTEPVGSGANSTTVSARVDLDFVYPSNICVLNPVIEITNIQGTANSLPCRPAIQWTLTNVATGAQTITPATPTLITSPNDPDRFYGQSFPSAGNYELCLTAAVACGGSARQATVCHDICINDNRTATYSLSIPAGSNIGTVAAPIVCAPAAINGSATLTAGFSCNAPIYNWSVTAQNSLTPIPGIIVAGANTANPSFNFTTKGNYTIRCSITGASCISPATWSQNITIAGPPIINLPSPPTICPNTPQNLWSGICFDNCFSTISQVSIAVYPGSFANCSIPVGVSSVFNDLVTSPTFSGASGCRPLSSSTSIWTTPASLAGNYTVVVSATNNCGITSQCFVLSTGGGNITGVPSSVCVNTPLVLPAGCTWQYRAVGGATWLSVPNPFNITAPVEVKQICTGAVCQPTQTVGVFPTFTAAITAPPAACANTAFSLAATTTPSGVGALYQWTNVSSGATSSNASATLASGSQSYNVSVTDANGCVASASATVAVESAATITTSLGPYCSTFATPIGLSGLLSGGAVPNGNVNWAISHNGNTYALPSGSSSFTIPSLLVNLPSSGTAPFVYTLNYSYQAASGCTHTGSASFVINIEGTVNSPSTALCAGTSLNFTGNGVWSWVTPPVGVNASIGSQNEYSFTPTAAMAGANVYVLSVNTGCSITNYPITVEQFAFTLIAAQTTVCYNTSASLEVVGAPAGTTFLWCNGNGPCTAPGLGTNSQWVSPALTTNSTFAVTVSNGACTYSSSITINVAPQAVYSPSTLPSECETSTASINLANLGTIGAANLGAIGQWRWNGGPWNGPLGSVTIPTLIAGLSINTDTTIPLDFQYTDPNGCLYNNSFSILIQNQGQSTQTLQACAGTVLSIAPGAGAWSNASLPSGAAVNANNDVTWNATPAQVGNYSLVFTNGCSQITYTVNVQHFTVGIASLQPVVCPGSTQQLTVSTTPAVSTSSISWFDSGGVQVGSGTIFTSAPLITSTNYTASVTSSAGCSYSNVVAVTVDQTPAYNATVLPAYYCSNTTDNLPLQSMVSYLGVYPSNAVWSWCTGSQAQPGPIAVSQLLSGASGCVIPTGGGIVTNPLTVSFTSVNGCPYTHTFSVDIKDYATLQVPVDLCANQSVVMNGVANGSWNVSDLPMGANLTYTNNNTVLTWQPSLADATPVSWQVRNEDPTCGAIQFNIILRTVPTVSPSSIASTCLNVPVPLSSTNSADVVSQSWTYNGNPLANPLFDAQALGIAPGSTVNICTSVTNNVACSASQCFNIQVIGLPTLFNPGGDYCLDTPYTMPACNCSSYSLTLTPPNGAPVVWTNATNSYSFPDNTIYDVQLVMTQQGCRDTLDATMVVRDTPVASITSTPYNECAPEFSIVNNSTGDDIQYTWTSNLPLTNLNDELPAPAAIVVPITNTSQQYNVGLIVSNLCGTSTDGFVVDFLAAPAAGVDIVLTSPNNCSPACFELVVTNPSTPVVNQVVYDFDGFAPNITTDNLEPIGELCWTVLTPQVPVISVTISNQCGTSTASDSLIIVPAQVEAEFSVVGSLCPGESTVIDDQSFAEIGIVPQYSVSPSNSGVIINGNQIVVPQNAQSGDYVITQTLTACGSDTESQPFRVGIVPSISIAPPQLGYCINTGIPFTAVVTGATVVDWSFGDGNSLLSGPIVLHEYESAGEYQVVGTTTSTDGCSAQDEVLVNLEGSNVDFNLMSDVVCGDDELVAVVDNNDWSDLLWQIQTLDGEVIYSYNDRDTLRYVFPSVNSQQDYLVVMRYTSVFGCVSEEFELLSVSPSVDVDVNLRNAGESCKFPVRAVIDVVASDQNVDYFYTARDLMRFNYLEDVTLEGVLYNSQLVTVTVVNRYGCKSTKEVVIECPVPLIYVPNAFTPNGDRINEGVKPLFSGSFFRYKWQIYDRWGVLVFETEDEQEHWYGQRQDGKEYFVQDGIYHWKLEVTAYDGAEVQDYQGHILIVR